MKKKSLITIVAIMLLIAISLCAAGCVKLSEAEKKIVGTYELTEIKVNDNPGISASSYEYFTIEFKDDKKCVVKSKAGAAVYSADAKWKINAAGELEVITSNGILSVTEKYTIDGDVITGTNSSTVEGQTITMTMKFTKVVEK